MRQFDLCLSSEGSEVVLATSSDEKHPPENIIDGNPETFWTTTGMFPQEFIICFHKHVKVEKLIIQSYLVRTLEIEKTKSKEPVDFERWIERVFGRHNIFCLNMVLRIEPGPHACQILYTQRGSFKMKKFWFMMATVLT
ncbi:intraflagellar transport protein 25 homolog isoform X2 [Callospermophilus lateralis]|uniref:intraflagellar transport protein 25 homolog isoform X2 n=1 Tax=Callospermophilus lateralis TaxID=76772 RepID=UPI004038AA18